MDITENIQYLRANSLLRITFFITLKMSGFEPTKQHMREVLLFYVNEKSAVIACFRKHLVNVLYIKQRAEVGSDGLNVTISTLNTKNVQDSRKNSKKKTWRHYSVKIAVTS